MPTYVYMMQDGSAIHIDQHTYNLMNGIAKEHCTEIHDFTSTITDRNVKDPDWRKRIALLTDKLAEQDKTIETLQKEIDTLLKGSENAIR